MLDLKDSGFNGRTQGAGFFLAGLETPNAPTGKCAVFGEIESKIIAPLILF
jgi:hypothetical protein